MKNHARSLLIALVGVLLVFGLACNLTNIIQKPDEQADTQEESDLTELELQLTESIKETEDAQEAEEAEPTNTPEPSRTPLPTNTPAPTNTSRPVYTPTLANPGLITEKDYYTEFQSLAGWFDFYIADNARPEYEVDMTDRGMSINVDTSDTYVYLIQEDLWYDEGESVYVEVEISTLEGVYDNNLGVACRVSEDGWYEFDIRTNGYWDFYRYDDDGGYTYLDGGGSWNINMKHDTNVIGMLCHGDTFTIYINGVETKDVHDKKYVEGGTGFTVATLEYGGLDFIIHSFTSVNDLSLVGLE